MYKIPVVINDNYTLFLQPAIAGLPEPGVIVHCDVYKWDRSVRDELLDDWYTLQGLHSYKPMFALHEKHQGKKHEKFLKIYGFSLIEWIDSERAIYGINHTVQEK